MHLIYVDETGNTGTNLNDPEQPIFLLGALVISEDKWRPLEEELEHCLEQYFPRRPDDFEVHAFELRRGEGSFDKFPVSHRIEFRDAWMDAAKRHDCRFIYRAIAKRRYQRWLEGEYGPGTVINPHLVAFALITQVVNSFLKEECDNALGLFVSDEHQQLSADVERFQKILRTDSSPLQLTQIIEKGFFIDSRKSLMIQLCDLFTYSARKKEEGKGLGTKVRPIDASGVEKTEQIIHRGKESLTDVIERVKSV
ncbi:MAG: hypothetical protein ACI9R3_003279 [Verrucomicrobiales bacterium]|jgi:hypothetical protein